MRIIYLLLWRTEEKNFDSTYFVDVRSQCRTGHFLFVGGGHLIWIIVKVCQILLLFVLWQFRTLQGPFSSCFFYVSASWFFFFKYIHVSLSVKRFTFDHKSLSNCSTVMLTHEFLAGLDDIGLYLPLDYNKRICFDWCDFRSFLIFLSPIVCSGTPPVRVRLVHNLAAWRYFCGYGYSRWPFFASPRPPAGGGQWRRAGDDGVGPDSQRPGGSAGLCPAGELHQWGGLHREPAQALQREPDLCE